MRRAERRGTRFLLAGAAVAGCLACDWPQRAHDPALDAPPLPPGSIEVEPVPPGGEAPPPPPPDRPTLPDAIPAQDQALMEEGLRKIDLAAALAAGTLTLESNDARVKASADLMFDGDRESLVRTDSINPLKLTLTFPEPIGLIAARVVLAGSPYDWLIEPVAGESRLVARDVPERTWSAIRLPEAVETRQIAFEMLRLERDDFVHVNELELWVAAEP